MRKARLERSTLVSLLLVLAALHAPSARAQIAAPTIAAVRESLRTYDPEGARTLEALGSLHMIVRAGSPADPSVREARFLRAALASDLLIVGALDASRAPAPERIASALRIPRDELIAHLRGELVAVGGGPFRVAADEAVAALDAMSGEGRGGVAAARSGPRRDALRALATAEAIEMGADPLAALAALAGDPGAAEPAQAWLDAQGRRAWSALTVAHEALARLAGPSRDDPFVHAVAPALAEAAATLGGVELAPSPLVAPSLASPGDERGAVIRPDVVIAVGEDALNVAWTPAVRVVDGRVVMHAPGPALDAPERVALPRELRPVIGPVEEITALASQLASRRSAPVIAVTVTDAPAHVLVRTLVSLARAGLPAAYVARRDSEGHLRGVPVRLLEPGEVEDLRGNLHVRVRTGGIAVSRRVGRDVEIDRVRDGDALRQDLEGLARAASALPHETVSIEAMSSVPARDVLDTAFRVAPAGGFAMVRR